MPCTRSTSARGNDTVLASIASTAPVEVGASATDVYVLAQEPNTSRVWRVARTGGSPVEVMTFASAASNLHVGTTNVSVFSAPA